MVLGVCRRTAGHADDADDAFQATFLVLARKAATIRAPAQLGAWLYGVAYRIARKVRAAADRRRGRERQVKTMPQPAVEIDDRWQEIAPLLDRELSRLPDKYRIPIILCDLEGALARRLRDGSACRRGRCPVGWRPGGVCWPSGWRRYGLAVSGGALAAALARQASAAVPAALSAATVQAVVAYGTTTAAVSAKVAVLAEGVMKAMLWTKLKIAAVVLAAGLLFVGAGAAALGPGKAGAAGPPKADPTNPAADAEPDSKPADGGGKHAEWVLDFRFKNLRLIQVDVPGGGKKLMWYLTYTVANPTDQEHTFIPDFELAAADKEGRHDQLLSAAIRQAIEQIEDPDGAIGRVHLKNSVTIAADPLPPTKPGAAAKATAGVATWDHLDADGGPFSLYVGGLSNAWAADEERQVRRKTLRLDFREDGGQMRLVGEPQWLYRPSKAAAPEPADQADELRRTIADLRRQLEKARYAAAITDAEKALDDKDKEIAVLRDKLASAQIQVEALTDRCKALEQRIKELEKGKKDDKPADAPLIEGKVTQVDGGLATISIGLDAGVAKGMTLDVYRPDPPTYLGRLRIINARPTGAVGQMIGKQEKPIQAGDQLSNRLDGK